MNLPENLKYTKDHEWIRFENNEAVVGITDFTQGELGDVVFIEIETEGETLTKDEVFGTVEAVKTVSDLFMPVSGEVIAVNPLITKQPELVNSDPYGDGWMIRIRVNDKSDLDLLLSADEYKNLILSK